MPPALVVTVAGVVWCVLIVAAALALVAARKRGWLVCRRAARVYSAWIYATYVLFSVVVLRALLGVPGWVGGLLVLGVGGYALGWECGGLVRRHAPHAVDCVYGPPTEPRWSRARLWAWRKVAIRPGFAAT